MPVARDSKRRLRAVFLLTLYWTTGGFAQQAVDEDIDQLTHFAYSALFGSGFYRLDDRSVAVLRIPLAYRLRRPDGRRPGIRLLAPLTIGIHDFDFEDIAELGSDDLATLSLVPGVELEFEPTPLWSVRPSVHAGIGRDVSNGETAWIYGTRLTTQYRFERPEPRFAVGGELLWSGYTPDEGSAHFLTRLALGVDAKFPVSWKLGGKPAFLATHFISYFYLNELEFNTLGTEDIDVREELEIGLSIGTDPPMEIFGFRLERLGLAYRFSGEVDAIVFVTSFPF